MLICFSKTTDVTIWIPTLTRNYQIIRREERGKTVIVRGGGVTTRNIFL